MFLTSWSLKFLDRGCDILADSSPSRQCCTCLFFERLFGKQRPLHNHSLPWLQDRGNGAPGSRRCCSSSRMPNSTFCVSSEVCSSGFLCKLFNSIDSAKVSAKSLRKAPNSRE